MSVPINSICWCNKHLGYYGTHNTFRRTRTFYYWKRKNSIFVHSYKLEAQRPSKPKTDSKGELVRGTDNDKKEENPKAENSVLQKRTLKDVLNSSHLYSVRANSSLVPNVEKNKQQENIYLERKLQGVYGPTRSYGYKQKQKGEIGTALTRITAQQLNLNRKKKNKKDKPQSTPDPEPSASANITATTSTFPLYRSPIQDKKVYGWNQHPNHSTSIPSNSKTSYFPDFNHQQFQQQTTKRLTNNIASSRNSVQREEVVQQDKTEEYQGSLNSCSLNSPQELSEHIPDQFTQKENVIEAQQNLEREILGFQVQEENQSVHPDNVIKNQYESPNLEHVNQSDNLQHQDGAHSGENQLQMEFDLQSEQSIQNDQYQQIQILQNDSESYQKGFQASSSVNYDSPQYSIVEDTIPLKQVVQDDVVDNIPTEVQDEQTSSREVSQIDMAESKEDSIINTQQQQNQGFVEQVDDTLQIISEYSSIDEKQFIVSNKDDFVVQHRELTPDFVNFDNESPFAQSVTSYLNSSVLQVWDRLLNEQLSQFERIAWSQESVPGIWNLLLSGSHGNEQNDFSQSQPSVSNLNSSSVKRAWQTNSLQDNVSGSIKSQDKVQKRGQSQVQRKRSEKKSSAQNTNSIDTRQDVQSQKMSNASVPIQQKKEMQSAQPKVPHKITQPALGQNDIINNLDSLGQTTSQIKGQEGRQLVVAKGQVSSATQVSKQQSYQYNETTQVSVQKENKTEQLAGSHVGQSQHQSSSQASSQSFRVSGKRVFTAKKTPNQKQVPVQSQTEVAKTQQGLGRFKFKKFDTVLARVEKIYSQNVQLSIEGTQGVFGRVLVGDGPLLLQQPDQLKNSQFDGLPIGHVRPFRVTQIPFDVEPMKGRGPLLSALALDLEVLESRAKTIVQVCKEQNEMVDMIVTKVTRDGIQGTVVGIPAFVPISMIPSPSMYNEYVPLQQDWQTKSQWSILKLEKIFDQKVVKVAAISQQVHQPQVKGQYRQGFNNTRAKRKSAHKKLEICCSIVKTFDYLVLEKLKVGSVVDCKVTNVKNFGAFVDIDGITFGGLVHQDNITGGRFQKVEDVLKKGEHIRACVIKVEEDLRKVTLSTRVLEGKKGDMLMRKQWVFDNADRLAEEYQKRLQSLQKQMGVSTNNLVTA